VLHKPYEDADQTYSVGHNEVSNETHTTSASEAGALDQSAGS